MQIVMRDIKTAHPWPIYMTQQPALQQADFKASLAVRSDPRALNGLDIAAVHAAYESVSESYGKQDFDTAAEKFYQLLKLQSEMLKVRKFSGYGR